MHSGDANKAFALYAHAFYTKDMGGEVRKSICIYVCNPVWKKTFIKLEAPVIGCPHASRVDSQVGEGAPNVSAK